MFDSYTSPPWPSLCEEIAKLRIQLREGRVIDLPDVEKRLGKRADGAEK